MLRFFDPLTESYLDTHEEERAGRMAAQAGASTAEARAETAEARAEEERTDRLAAETRAQEEVAARLAAEARMAELEEELQRLRGE